MSYRQTFLDVNGMRLSAAVQGSGPLVILCHGFPETSHAWRHQLKALADAGYHAVAPDLRGYGKSQIGEGNGFNTLDILQYSTLDVVGDLVAIVENFDARQAVVVGNDWGATIAWQAAQLRPDLFCGIVALGVPMMGRAPMRPSQLFPITEDAMFYTHYLSGDTAAQSDLEKDVARSLRRIYFAASGDVGVRTAVSPNPFGMHPRNGPLLVESLPEPESLPAWLPEADLEVFCEAFRASGFGGGLNYYRNLDRNWEMQAAFAGISIKVPALYMVGERDTGLVIPGMQEIINAMPTLVPKLCGSHIVPKAGHWLQQEAPEAVNVALLTFLQQHCFRSTTQA